MSDLLDTGSAPSGWVFPGVSTAPVGVAAGILPANGSIVSLATYPTLAYLNDNLGYLTGPAYVRLGAYTLSDGGFNCCVGGLYMNSATIGPYAIQCGYNSEGTTVLGPSISFSTDLVNWSNGQISADAGRWCVGIAKLGATYYATVAGTAGYDYIYSSTNLTAWTLAFTYGGGAPIYGMSQMAASNSIVVSFQGGCNNIVFFNGAKWIFDNNDVGGAGNQSLLNVLSTGEIGGVTLTQGSTSPYTFSAWKVGAGSTATTVHVIDAGFTNSLLAPAPAAYSATAINNLWNAKLSYAGGNYVATIFGVVYTSPDFVAWTRQGDMQFIAMENIGGTLYGIAIAGGVNKYYSSPDGVAWTLYYTSPMSQGFTAGSFGAKILEISPTLWAVCSSVENGIQANGYMLGYNTTSIAFIYNPTTMPLVQQSYLAPDICVDTYSVNPAGTGIMAGSYSIIPAFNPEYYAQLPNLTSSAGAGTAMFLKI